MFSFHTKNHLRIWFSGEPDCFLNPENQLRMVQFRAINPSAKVTMLYSSRLLTESSITQFRNFCEIHRFELLDFDLFEELCVLVNDATLYRLAREEIDAFVTRKGGNLAVASDLTRLLSFVLGRGTYSDFDTFIDVESLNDIVPIHHPMILNIGSVGSGKSEYFQFNNDLIGVASDGNIIHPAALDELQIIQKGIIQACSQGPITILAQRAAFLKKHNPLTRAYLEGAFNILERWGKDKITVPGFRYFLELFCSNGFSYLRVLNDVEMGDLSLSSQLKDKLKGVLETEDSWDYPQKFSPEERDLITAALTEHLNVKYKVTDITLDELLSFVKNEWIRESESLFTGPCCFYLLLNAKSRDELAPRSFDGNGLYEEFYSPQSNKFGTSEEDNFINLEHRGGDASWLPHGQMSIKAKEEGLHRAARVIQQSWKKYSLSLFPKPVESTLALVEAPQAQCRVRSATI